MPHPFRFGVGLGEGPDPVELAEHARTVEALGYDVLLVADHLVGQLAPTPVLTAAALATSRLRLGTFVLNNDLRHPVLLAQELATVDQLSAGRLEIGIGAGWDLVDYQRSGIPFRPHPERAARLAEAVAVLVQLFGEQPCTFDGRHYHVDQLDGWPKPVQRPHPPLLIGGGGRRLLELAARSAQIVGLAPRIGPVADIRSCLAPATEQKLGWVRAAAGERFSSLVINSYTALGPVTMTDHARREARRLADRLEAQYGVALTEDELLDSPHALIGSVDELVEKCRALRERFGISYLTIFGDPRPFAPVLERLSGM